MIEMIQIMTESAPISSVKHRVENANQLLKVACCGDGFGLDNEEVGDVIEQAVALIIEAHDVLYQAAYEQVFIKLDESGQPYFENKVVNKSAVKALMSLSPIIPKINGLSLDSSILNLETWLLSQTKSKCMSLVA